MPSSVWRRRFAIFDATAWDAVVYWALDLETSGLRVGTDCILSLGMVPIRSGIIHYGERYHSLVRPPDLSQLSTEGLGAHHIMPADIEAAPTIGEVLPEVDGRLRGAVLLVHHASVDVAFLEAAYARTGLTWPRPDIVDTVNLVLQLHRRQHAFVPHPPPPRAGLPAAREALGLPPYRHHDALADALATAELFLALRSRLGAATLRALR